MAKHYGFTAAELDFILNYGELAAPDGRRPRIRTVWQLDAGQLAPRLITAHPLEANA